MAIHARFVHVNLIARDWRRLAGFYREVFGCVAVPPERDLAGDWLDAATGLEGAHLSGVHLRLPGGGPEGPTLEIFGYDKIVERPAAPPNATGFGHVAFAVEDVARATRAVLEAGGTAVGERAELEVPGAGRLEFQYVRDPEGNVVELQRWFGQAAAGQD